MNLDQIAIRIAAEIQANAKAVENAADAKTPGLVPGPFGMAIATWCRDGEGSGTYTVSLEDVEGTVSSFPSFTAMPSPKQVLDLVKSGKRTGSMRGNQMPIDPKAL